MSIWCSHEDIGYDDDPDLDGKPVRGEVRSYAEGWSNHYPTTDGEAEQPATVGIATIPPWCVPGHGESSGDYPVTGPWVRLDVHSPGALTWWTTDGEKPAPAPIHAAVVLDEAAARALAADLLAWADGPKVYPRPPG